jgi:hypothetical protein
MDNIAFFFEIIHFFLNFGLLNGSLMVIMKFIANSVLSKKLLAISEELPLVEVLS